MDEVRFSFGIAGRRVRDYSSSIVEIPINGKFRLVTNPCKGRMIFNLEDDAHRYSSVYMHNNGIFMRRSM